MKMAQSHLLVPYLPETLYLSLAVGGFLKAPLSKWPNLCSENLVNFRLQQVYFQAMSTQSAISR
jgi:hypothetical protein